MLGVLTHIPLGRLPECSNEELLTMAIMLLLLALAACLGKRWWG